MAILLYTPHTSVYPPEEDAAWQDDPLQVDPGLQPVEVLLHLRQCALGHLEGVVEPQTEIGKHQVGHGLSSRK